MLGFRWPISSLYSGLALRYVKSLRSHVSFYICFSLLFKICQFVLASHRQKAAKMLCDQEAADQCENAILMRADIHACYDQFHIGIYVSDHIYRRVRILILQSLSPLEAKITSFLHSRSISLRVYAGCRKPFSKAGR